MISIDLHTHTSASHGENSVAEMRAAARLRGIKIQGFSEHSPRPRDYVYPSDYGAHLLAAFPRYAEEVLAARAGEDAPRTLFGMELDWLPAERAFMEQAADADPFDYIIGGIHFLGHWGFDASAADWEKLNPDERDGIYARYFDELRNMATARHNGKRLADIAAHPDIIKLFSISDFRRWIALPASLRQASDALVAIRDAGMAMEISSAGLRKPCAEIYPHPAIMGLAAEIGVAISFGSDAHCVNTPAYAFDQLEAYAASFGYTESRYFVGREARALPFSG